VQLDPRSAQLFYDPGGTSYQVVRRYVDAVRAYDRALSLAPDFHLARVWRGWAYLHWQGQLDTLRSALDRVPEDAEIGGFLASATAQRAMLLLWERDTEGLLRLTKAAQEELFVGQGALLPASLYAGWAHRLRGEQSAAREAFEGARRDLDARSATLPEDWRVHAGRGYALAGLGRRAEAIQEARWLAQSPSYVGDKGIMGPLVAEERARILAQAGDVGAACEEIERLLAGPSWLSVHTLRLDPRWDPIREDPRFKALLVKYANPEEWAVR
jgi:serine/threonine-protein kinase